MSQILIADDDVELCAMLKEYLELEGFEVSQVHDGKSALDQALQQPPDVMVLDVMMPVMNGFDLLRALRPQSTVPVLMLTARGDDVDSIVGLELGADDYLGKPCNPRVLVARIRALLRRSEPNQPANLQIDDLTIDSRTRTACMGDLPLDLTSTEFNVLLALVQHAGEVLTKADLSEMALGRPLSAYDRSIDMHISHLRKKLGLGPNQQGRIQTVRGMGYQYTA